MDFYYNIEKKKFFGYKITVGLSDWYGKTKPETLHHLFAFTKQSAEQQADKMRIGFHKELFFKNLHPNH